MKRNNIKQGFLSLAAACLAFTACTGDFERFNTDPNSAQEVDLKMRYFPMRKSIWIIRQVVLFQFIFHCRRKTFRQKKQAFFLKVFYRKVLQGSV